MTLRNALFQVHWFLGITAGLVLALVGVTGGVLSFEDELLKAWNPGVMTVQPAGRTRLSTDALIAKVRAQRPDDRIQSLTLSRAADDAARIGFAPPKGAKGGGPGGRGPRGETRYVDPYSGQLLDKPRGEGFFRTNMQLHRWLAMDDVGKQIVAFSTVALIYFCLSGLYLRWPRRWGSLRTWLALDWKQKGRNFLWHLHSVFGTWVLIAYLVMSLTGLWWSYGWYRDAVNNWAGRQELPEFVQDAARGAPPAFEPATAWQAFEAAVPSWSEATMNWPKDDAPAIAFRYLDADPAHERARNELRLDPWTLQPDGHLRYADGSWKQKIGASMFALHRGSFFGTAGVVVFMLASLLMPLFAITGWLLYLERRKRQRDTKRLAASAAAALPGNANSGERVLVAYASQTGNAQRLAWQTATALADAGVGVDVKSLGTLAPAELAGFTRALFVVSTFGESQAPDAARGFARRMQAMPAGTLANLHYGVLALGDREYGDDFNGFGRELDQWLHHAGAQPLFDRVDVDGLDAGAIRHWQHHIGLLSGHTELPDWTPPDYATWTLAAREHLNPGSPGGPIFHIALRPLAGALPQWQAGDIAEVGSRNVPDAVEAYLAQTGHSGDAIVRRGDTDLALREVLAVSLWPEAESMRGLAPQALADRMQPLPHREYSIASLPADGSLQLLLRQMRRADGGLGLGSGWLTEAAPLGGDVAMRIRANPGFHPPGDDRPLLLVGNGTGIAGLRALLKARIAAGQHRNWLVFGERTQAHDFHYGDELQAWAAQGAIERLDLAFSRDGEAGQRRYVQHVLREHADTLRAWLEQGAAVYVCGSLEGMAPAVEAELVALVGQQALEQMAADGRYRRDVY
jgi:sulfite reductase (NADPH) flavoprotein alpha-component